MQASRRMAQRVRAVLTVMVAGSALGVARSEPLPELDCLIEPNLVVDIGSPTHGIVEKLSVDRSDIIASDQILATLDSSQQAAAVRKAQARAAMQGEIRTREAELALAERKQQRIRELYNSDAISSQQRDEVDTELKRAQMQLRQAKDARKLAKIELDRARSDLERRTIRSPIAGVVVERFVAPGEYVNEKPLMRVAQLHPLRIEALAPASLFGKISTGMQASVQPETGDAEAHTARVVVVDRMIDAASGTFGIRLELPNPDYAIPSGLNCRLQLSAAAPVPRSPPPATAKTTAETPPMACRRLGPFDDASQRDALATELGGIAGALRPHEQKAPTVGDHFVITPQFDSLAEARAHAAELRARGVEDLAVLTRGPHARRVSLGLYARRPSAERKRDQYAAMGIAVEVRPRHVGTTSYWLDVEMRADLIDRAPWQSAARTLQARACEPADYVADESIGLASSAD